MPSQSLQEWQTRSLSRLDEIEHAHQSVGGVSPGRRYATLQINHAYAVLLSSQFQGYCRDLHSECVNHLVSKVEVPTVAPTDLRVALREEFLFRRQLDTGNPNPGNIGSDFNRLGVDFWDKVIAIDPTKNPSRRNALLE